MPDMSAPVSQYSYSLCAEERDSRSPAADDGQPAEGDIEASGGPTTLPVGEKRGRVLVADDVAIVRLACEAMLLGAGYEVVTVEDGAEAVAEIRRDLSIDCVLTDVQMPRLDGIVAASRIRSLRPDIPICFMSAKPNIDTKNHADLKDAPILRKPFSQETLIKIIENLLGVSNDG